MKETLLHPSVELKINAMRKELPHALLLSGTKGVGLYATAQYIATNNQTKNSATVVKPDEKGTISIDTIRNLYKQTRTKQQQQQIIIIDDADAMGHEAQNAFLKLLEEPSSSTSFILTTHAPSKLLPTIHSRVQRVTIQPITKKQTEDFLTELEINDQKTRLQVQFIASGLPAEIARLHEDEQYFQQQAETTRNARELLGGNIYQKLLLVQRYSTDRQKTIELLEHAIHIIEFSLSQKTSSALASQLDSLLKTEKSIRENANAKIQLLKLVISA